MHKHAISISGRDGGGVKFTGEKNRALLTFTLPWQNNSLYAPENKILLVILNLDLDVFRNMRKKNIKQNMPKRREKNIAGKKVICNDVLWAINYKVL